MQDTAHPNPGAQPDEPVSAAAFQIAGWTVHPTANRMRCGSDTVKLEPKVMRVLVYLANRHGQTVTRDELARAVWSGTVVGDDAVTNAIIKLRKAFGDDSRSPKVIETIPKLGYRLVSKIQSLQDDEGRADTDMAPVGSNADSAGPRTESPTIAVLPFRNVSGDPEQDYFSDGITEDIITALANVRSFQVASPPSVFIYKNRDVDVKTVGRELGARYVIEGSVRRAANRMRVSASLSDAAAAHTVWAQRFDGTPQDIFDFQDEITQAIVGAVGPQLSRAEADRAIQKRPESLDAYEHLLRALFLMNKRTEADAQVALDHCYKAIDLDARYARAYAFASWCYRRHVQLRGMVLSDKDRAECIRLIEEALRLDEEDPVVLWQASVSVSYVQGNLERGLDLANRSIEMDPNSTRAYKARGSIYYLLGMPDEAIADVERAQKLSSKDPSLWVAYSILAIGHFQLKHYEDCITWSRRALAENVNNVRVQPVLAASLALTGELDEARAFIRGWKTEDPELTVTRLEERFCMGRSPNLEAFRNALRKAGLQK